MIEAHEDAGTDTIDCGDGIDLVRFDAGVDVVADNCERRNPHGVLESWHSRGPMPMGVPDRSHWLFLALK